MAARGYEEDYDAFDDNAEVVEQSHADEEEEDWGIFSSSSPSSSSPAPAFPPATATATATAPAPAKRNRAPASPLECSMDDDSSTEGEEVDTARSKRRATSSCQHSDLRQSQAAVLQQRRAKIKELQMKYQQECLSLCRSLLPLQRQWRQELEDPIPGLISYDHQNQEEVFKQREFSGAKSATQMQSVVPKFQSTSAVASNVQSPAMTATDHSLRRDSKSLLRRKLPWRSNEREAIRRGILMFGVGRSEKVRAVMRGYVKHLQHGLGDIADCSWEFVRACSAYSDLKESAYIENLLSKAEDLGVEVGLEVSERVGQWEKMEKLGGVWLKRIKLLDSLGHVIRLCASPATQEIAYDAIDSLGDATVLCEWWTRDSDLALLAGTYEHGFGNYEALRRDDQFAEAFGPFWDEKLSRERGLMSNSYGQNFSKRFYDHDPDANPITRDSIGESSWPDTNLLTRRLKRLVEHLSRINEQEVDIEKRSGKKAKHGQMWSKREKMNFLRMLFTWGLPVVSPEQGGGGQVSWQFFKDQASVRPMKSKKDSSLEACYEELMKEMKQLLEGSELHESGSADNAGSSDESEDKDHSEFGEPSPQGPSILTHKTAGRLKERLELLDTLRHASKIFSEDWKNVGLLVQQSHNLPSWWQSGSHDRQLVMGVLKHGFGNWDAIFSDETYNFRLEREREMSRRGLSTMAGEDVDSSWPLQHNEEQDEFLKAMKGKRSVSPGGFFVLMPCPKSCVKRLRFIGSILRRHLQKRGLLDKK